MNYPFFVLPIDIECPSVIQENSISSKVFTKTKPESSKELKKNDLIPDFQESIHVSSMKKQVQTDNNCSLVSKEKPYRSKDLTQSKIDLSQGTNNNFSEEKLQKWRKELNKNGFILCEKQGCDLAFLSLRGMERHQSKCNEFLQTNHFPKCPVCSLRFTNFINMDKHRRIKHSTNR